MPIGPGKYDDLCTHAREASEAQGVILIVIQGKLGSGFSAQLMPGNLLEVATALRKIADQVERDANAS